MFHRTQDFKERRNRPGDPMRRGGVLKVVVVILLIVGVVGGALAWRWNRSKATKQVNVIYATVERGTFLHEVNGKGSAESAMNIDVASQVEGSATIIYLIPEGSDVKKGDKLVELDSSDIDEKLDSQVVTTNSSRATLNSSRATLRSAEISLEEYVEGTFEQSWMDYENSIFEAEQTRKQSADSARYTERLLNLNYSTELQYEIDKVAEEKARNSLEVARLKRMTLLRYTSEKQITSLMSDIETARAKVDSDKNSYNINLSRENRYRAQSANCRIRAPQDGQVVYANQDSRRMSESEMIKEGSTVRQRQVLIRLPDKTQMQVKAMINEANISAVAVGMEAKITFDSIPNRVFQGEVVKVNLYPEIVWMSSAKDYVTLVRILEDVPELRSGLTAQVRIVAERQEDVLTVPVQCVTEVGQKTYCVTYKDGVWGYVEVLLGSSNDKQVVILEGLNEGDVIVSGARLYRDRVVFPEPSEPSAFADSPIYQERMATAKAEEEKQAQIEENASGTVGSGAAPGGMPGAAPGGMMGAAPGGMPGAAPGGDRPDFAAIAEKIKSGDVPKEMLAAIPPDVLARIQGGGASAGASDEELEERAQKHEEAREYAATIEARLARDVKIAAIRPFFSRTVMEMQRELLAAIQKKTEELQARIAERQNAILRRQEEIELLQKSETTDAAEKVEALIAEIKTLRGDSDADPLERVVYLDQIDWAKYVSGNDITREALTFLSEQSDAIFESLFPNSKPIDAVAASQEVVGSAEEEDDWQTDLETNADLTEYASFLPLFDEWDSDGDGNLKPTEFVVGFFSDRKSFQDSETDEIVDEMFKEFDEDGDGTISFDEADRVADKILRERAEPKTASSGRGGRGGRGGAFPGLGGPNAGGPGAGGPGAGGPGAGGSGAGAPQGEANPGVPIAGTPNPSGLGAAAPEGEDVASIAGGPEMGAPNADASPIDALEDATNLRQAIALYVKLTDFNGDSTIQKEEFVKGYHVVNDAAGKLFSSTVALGAGGDSGFGGGFPGPPM